MIGAKKKKRGKRPSPAKPSGQLRQTNCLQEQQPDFSYSLGHDTAKTHRTKCKVVWTRVRTDLRTHA